MAVRQRLFYMDLARGLALLAVVIYQLLIPSGFQDALGFLFVEPLTGLFFFISGYCSRSSARPFVYRTGKRAAQLLFPFFSYSLTQILIGSLLSLLSGRETLPKLLYAAGDFYTGGLWNAAPIRSLSFLSGSAREAFPFLFPCWFLLQMFFASVLFYALAGKLLSSLPLSAAGFILLVGITAVCFHLGLASPFNLQTVPFFAALMLAGAFAGKQRFFEKLPAGESRTSLYMAASFLFSVLLSFFFLKDSALALGCFGDLGAASVLLCLIREAAFILPVLFFCRFLENTQLRTRELALAGQNALPVYLTHLFFAWVILRLFGLRGEPASLAALPEGAPGFDVLLILASLCLSFFYALICLLRSQARAGRGEASRSRRASHRKRRSRGKERRKKEALQKNARRRKTSQRKRARERDPDERRSFDYDREEPAESEQWD